MIYDDYMDDTTFCPICKNKLRAINLNQKFLHLINKTADYVERVCANGMNHTIQFFSDKSTDKIDLLKISLNPKYSVFLQIDFINKKSIIQCFKDGKSKNIEIQKIIELDFPLLSQLKNKIDLYIVVS